MASANGFALILIAAALVLLVVVNQLGWLLGIVPVSLLLARALAVNRHSPDTLARGGGKS